MGDRLAESREEGRSHDGSGTLPERPRTGEVVDGYEIVGLVAGGGMGEVLLVRRRRAGGFEKHLAMKVMHPHHAVDPAMVAMFLDEARIASQVAHANVVEVIDTGIHRGLPWLVMELIDGRSLVEVAAERPPAAFLAHVLARAALGLHAAHEAKDASGAPLGIVHRDVSPQNVLVALDGRVKVVDFGIAAARGRLAHTATGELKGKIGYLAPELLSSGRRPATRAADVWAFGVMAWECFAGRRLFDADGASARMRQVEAGEIAALTDEAPGIDPSIAELVERCLARDVAQRVASLEPIARGLARAAESGGHASTEHVEQWMRARFSSRIRARAAIEESTLPGGASVARDRPDDDAPAADDAAPGSGVRRSRRPPPRRATRRWVALAIAVLVGVSTSVWLATRRDEVAPAAAPALVPPSQPAVIEPAAIEPTTIEPTTIEPATTEPTTTEPTTTEPTTTEPIAIEPVRATIRPRPRVVPPALEPAPIAPAAPEPDEAPRGAPDLHLLPSPYRE